MTDGNCLKCGTKIPKGAKFCPSCGAVKAVGTSQPVQPQPMPSASRPMHEALEPLFSKTLIIVGVLFGILFAWIGRNIAVGGGFGLISVATYIRSLGFFAMSLFLMGGGIVNKDIDKYVRLGMIIAGAITISMGI